MIQPIEGKKYFTIGVVVEVSGPTTAKTGKTYFSIKISTLNRYDTSKIRKILIPEISEIQGNPGKIGAAERSFNENGYKTVKLLAFGEELCRPLAKKIEIPGLVVAFSDLKPLDFSENSG